MTKKQNRTLGAFEKTFWLLDQIDSKDFALAAEVEGKETAVAWQSAIRQVQQRHPNLSVRIVMDEFNRPAIEHVDSLEIPLRVLDVDNDFKWEQEVEKELSIRFDTSKGPLLRVLILQKPQDTVVILVANHTLVDGSSLNYLFRDMLNAVTGQKLEILAPQKSNDETLGLPDDVAITETKSAGYVFKKINPVYPKVERIRFSEASTLRILEKSRLEQTTVHGAICAAAVIAGRKLHSEWANKKLELISPICTRRALELDDNFGLNITTHPVYFEPELDPYFWDVARLAKSGLAGTDTAAHVQNYIGFFRELTFNSTDIQQMIDILKQAFNHDIMVTNLVKVKYDTNFGKLRLKSVYGPMVRSGKGKEQTIGAISSNGQLCLTNTSDNPIPGILKEMENILLKACHEHAESIA
ncbi:condensation domain-containing protein [Pedobacter alluvionis]|uniref:Phthiocerol/phthiodiolone dimycocerosyl transferase n=1 Tax=Pedobacter alluvionis TaxID=475253 RepID=A0A497YHZ9_9SPHI|nr:condensation domain-containing protein [Pedobacter alluvionis]RLJ80992.1 condensation domain-containing protein [Pedobacter alluvionis]TFB27896.1 condensation protein [Pedobacter alluvionis]